MSRYVSQRRDICNFKFSQLLEQEGCSSQMPALVPAAFQLWLLHGSYSLSRQGAPIGCLKCYYGLYQEMVSTFAYFIKKSNKL